MFVRLCLVAIIFLLPAGARAAATLKHLGDFESGQWLGSAYAEGKTDKFFHCTIMAEFNSGIRLYFRMNRHSRMLISLLNDDWHIDKKTLGKIALYVDDEKLGQFKIVRFSDSHIGAFLGANERIFQRLSYGRHLRIVAPQETFEFKLTGTAKALARTRACVKRHLALEPGSTNPFAETPKPKADRNPFRRFDRSKSTDRKVARNYQKPRTRSKGRDIAREAWELVAMIAVGESARIVPVEPRLRKIGIEQSWSSPGIRGYAGRWKSSSSIKSLTNRIMGAIGSGCDDYATITHKSERVADSEVTTAFAKCRTDQKIKYIAATGSRKPNIFSFFIHVGEESKRDALHAINGRLVAFIRGISKKAEK